MQTGNGGMHPSQMQMGVQRMPMDRQNFPQQIQYGILYLDDIIRLFQTCSESRGVYRPASSISRE
jgi:hypothetical protein